MDAETRDRLLRMAGILEDRNNPRPGRQVDSAAGVKQYGLPMGADIVPGVRKLTALQQADVEKLSPTARESYQARRKAGATHAEALKSAGGSRKPAPRKAAPATKAAPAKKAAPAAKAPEAIDRTGSPVEVLAQEDDARKAALAAPPVRLPDMSQGSARAKTLRHWQRYGDEEANGLLVRGKVGRPSSPRKGYVPPSEEQTRQFIADLDAIMASSTLDEPITVYRSLANAKSVFPGMGEPGSLVGREFTEKRFSSTSASRRESMQFMAGEGMASAGVVLEIRVPAGVRAVDISDEAFKGASPSVSSEQEILLERGLRYRVVSDEMVPDLYSWLGEATAGEPYRHVVVEVLPPERETKTGTRHRMLELLGIVEVRADYYNIRRPKDSKGGGRFRKISDQVIGVLESWINGGGENDGLDRFTPQQLHNAAEQLRVPHVGKTIDEVKAALREKAKADYALQRAENDAKAGTDLGTPNTPPVGTRRDLPGGAYMVRVAPEKNIWTDKQDVRGPVDEPDVWAVHNADGELLGHVSTIDEATKLAAAPERPAGTRVQLGSGIYGDWQDGQWLIHRPDQAEPIGSADSLDAAQKIADDANAKRLDELKPKGQPVDLAAAHQLAAQGLAVQGHAAPTMTAEGKAPRKRTTKQKAEDLVASGTASPDTVTRLLKGESAVGIVDSQTPKTPKTSVATGPIASQPPALPMPVSAVDFDARVKAARKGTAATAQVPYRFTGTGTANSDIFPDAVERIAVFDAFNSYKGIGSRNINLRLRKGDTDSRTAKIDLALERSSLKHDIVVYRGARGTFEFGPKDSWPADLTGREWTDLGYTSTSPNRVTTEPFANEGVLLRIVAPEGTPAVALRQPTRYDQPESEILFGRGTRFRVVADHGFDSEGRRLLDIEVAPSGSAVATSTSSTLDRDAAYAKLGPIQRKAVDALDNDRRELYWTRREQGQTHAKAISDLRATATGGKKVAAPRKARAKKAGATPENDATAEPLKRASQSAAEILASAPTPDDYAKAARTMDGGQYQEWLGNLPQVQAVRAAVDGDFAGLTVRSTNIKVIGGDQPQITFTGEIFDASGKRVGAFIRSIRPDSEGRLVAHHADLTLDRDVQGSGFAKAFNDNLLDWYRRSGVNRVEMLADVSVGGYAWARAGYDFEDARTADEFINSSLIKVGQALQDLRNGYPLSSAAPGLRSKQELFKLRAHLLDIEAGRVPARAADIAGFGRRKGQTGKDAIWPGKWLMLGSMWRGVLYL